VTAVPWKSTEIEAAWAGVTARASTPATKPKAKARMILMCISPLPDPHILTSTFTASNRIFVKPPA
jgi:hypothetical protein